jgi:hypothetical protein
MRMAKIKDSGSVVRSLQHNTRERMPANADPQKTKKNDIWGGDADEAMKRFEDKLPSEVRKNAVLAVELVMTASPDFVGDWNKYLIDCEQWAKKLFGGDKNLLSVAIHRDETTPHTHVLIMPLKDGRLNANHFIGGSRDRMAELQEDFYEKVGKRFELERGQSKSETKSRHSHHTLAGKTAELDEREKAVSDREAKLNHAGEDFKRLMGMKPSDVRELKTLVANWDKASPAGLRVIAKDIEQSGAATVGEYRQNREAQRQREQQQKNIYSR